LITSGKKRRENTVKNSDGSDGLFLKADCPKLAEPTRRPRSLTKANASWDDVYFGGKADMGEGSLEPCSNGP